MPPDVDTILGTPPPSGTPPPDPQTIAPVQQSVDVNAPQAQPLQPESQPLYQTIPTQDQPDYNQPPSPGADEHINWLHRAMNKVADVLGPEEIATVHKDKDGNVSVTRDPASYKDKWGRIAALALGGAAQGLANSQGPGGLARAASAGIQFGMKLPQQQQQQTEAEASAQQKLMEGNANNAFLHQRNYMAMLQGRQLGMTIDDATAKQLNAMNDDLQSDPNAKVLGDVTDFNSMKSLFDQNADFMHKHTNFEMTAAQVPDGKNGTKLVAIAHDPGYANRRTDRPRTMWTVENDPDDPTKPIGVPHTVNPGQDTNGHIDLANQQAGADLTTRYAKWATAQKDMALAGKPANQPKTFDEAYAQASVATDPAEKKRLNDLGDLMFNKAKGLRTVNQISLGAGIPQNTPIADLIKPGGVFAEDTVNGVNAQKLATGDITSDKLPKRLGKGVPTPQEMNAGAEAWSRQMYGLPYSDTLIEQEKKLFENPKLQATMDGIDKLTGLPGQPGFLGQVLHLAQQTGMGDTAPLNEIEKTIKTKLGDAAWKNFNTAMGETQRALPQLIGNPLMGGSDTDMKLRMAQDMFGANPTLGNIKSTAGELATMMQQTKMSYVNTNRFLQRRYGLQGPYAKGGAANAAGLPQPPAAAAPTAQGNTGQAAIATPPRPTGVPANYLYQKGPQGLGWYKPAAPANP